MQSRTTRQFWRLFSHLPADAQRDAKRSYRLFRTNPAHPSLHFKKLEGEDNIYSVRIGLEYRALAAMNKVCRRSPAPKVYKTNAMMPVHINATAQTRSRLSQALRKSANPSLQ